MEPGQFGPFANVVAIACALVATFGVLLVKMLGRFRRWTWLTQDSPSFLVTAAARVVAVALMAVTYVTIDRSNFGWFCAAAVLTGLLGLVSVIRFDLLRKAHVAQVPLTGPDGQQLTDARGREQYEQVVIGGEGDLLPRAKSDLALARARSGGVSLTQFMSGYGASKLNDPTALWDREYLARVSNRITMWLIAIALFAVITIFLAAFVVEVAGRAT